MNCRAVKNKIISQQFNQRLQISLLLVRCERAAARSRHPRRTRGKIRLKSLEIEYNRGYNKAELNKVLKLTELNETKLLEAWHEHFDR